MNDFKIRCSAIGKIMTNSRSKTEILSKTAKSFCDDWLKEQIYSRRKEFTNKYTDKGITVEDNSLDFIADYLGYGLLLKNEEFFSNDYLQGTPDAITKDLVIDVKNSWDCFTFPLFETEITNKDYWWQLQGYMALTGKPKAKLIYTLMDTPEHIIEKEDKWNNPLELDYDEFRQKFLYKSIDIKHRIKIFDIERDDEAIKQINERVLVCRDYIKTLI